MKWSFKRELARKFVHFLSIFILLIYFLISDFFSEKIALIILVLILMIFLEFEYLRIEVGKKIPILNKIWSYVRRKKEKNKLGGDIFFLIGAILVLAVFDTRIAIAAILMTTLGDLSAALIGKKFGKHTLLKTKSWEGTIAEFVVNIIIGLSIFIIYPGLSLLAWHAWIIILVMALTATFVETVVFKLDDNLLIPVFAGFNGQIALWIVSYF
ncbi:MAG: diacylglycerol/polyprenol kinase family protein [Nanoarchaeota archaeon]